jgi:hypothetical protein
LLVFDDNAGAPVISPASHFMVASMIGAGKNKLPAVSTRVFKMFSRIFHSKRQPAIFGQYELHDATDPFHSTRLYFN